MLPCLEYRVGRNATVAVIGGIAAHSCFAINKTTKTAGCWATGSIPSSEIKQILGSAINHLGLGLLQTKIHARP